MVNMSTVSFIIIIQLLIMLTMLSALLTFLLIKKNSRLKALLPAIHTDKDQLLRSSVEHYLTAEIKLTSGRFDSLYNDNDLLSEQFSEADWLKLRVNYLETEKEFLANDLREGIFWNYLGDKFKQLLKDSLLVKRIQIKEINDDDEEEIKQMKMLLKTQNDDFNDLALLLEGDKTSAEVAELKAKMMKISRSHTELSQCIFILEDENLFLRDQVSALIKDT